MGQDRITLKRKQPILIGHVCSWCGAPILSIVTINANVSKYYSFFGSKAKELINETMERVVSNEIDRIIECSTTLEPLLTNPCKDGKTSYNGCIYASWIDDVETRCPNCLRIELWQTLNPENRKMQKIEKSSFPIVFSGEEEGIDWIKNVLNEKTIPIGFESNDTENTDLKTKTIKTYLKIKDLKRKRENIPQLQRRDEVVRQKKYLLNLRDRLGLFDIKGKMTVRKVLKELNEENDKLYDEIKAQQSDIDKKMLNCGMELQRMQALVYGYTGKIVEKKRETAIAYLLELKGILKKDVEKYLENLDKEEG